MIGYDIFECPVIQKNYNQVDYYDRKYKCMELKKEIVYENIIGYFKNKYIYK